MCYKMKRKTVKKLRTEQNCRHQKPNKINKNNKTNLYIHTKNYIQFSQLLFCERH